MNPIFARILLYGVVFVAYTALVALKAYDAGKSALYEYQAKEARASVAVVTKTNTIVKEADDSALLSLQADYGDLDQRYKRLRSQSNGASHPVPAAAPGVSTSAANNAKQDTCAGYVREDQIFAVTEFCDCELTKFRNLWNHDVDLSRKTR